MKTNKLSLAILLLLLPLFCQGQSLFAKYCDKNDVSSVYISKTMIEMNPELYTQDVNIGKIAKQLELVQILSTMDNDIKRDMRRDIQNVVYSQKYELLMKQKGIVSRMAIYVQRKGEKVTDLIMVIDGAATLKYIRLVGDMTLKDIQNIMKSQTTSQIINPSVENVKHAIGNLNSGFPEHGDLENLRTELEELKDELEEMSRSLISELGIQSDN